MTSRYDVWATQAPPEEPNRVYITRKGNIFSVIKDWSIGPVKVVLLDMDKPEEKVLTDGPDPLYTLFVFVEEGNVRVEADSIDDLEVYVGAELCEELVTVELADEELLSTNGA